MTEPSNDEPSPGTSPHVSRLPRSLTSDPDHRVTVSIISGLAAWRMLDHDHPQLRRWTVPVFCAVLGLPSLLNPANRAHLPGEIVLTLAYTVPLLWRERRPGPVFAITTAVSVLALPLNVLNGADAARIVALYNVGRYGRHRHLVLACAVTAVQLVLWITAFWGSGQLQHAKRPETITLLAMFAVTACAGLALTGRLAKAYIVALETERDQQARLAAAWERTRVSREMHDILGHTLAVVIGLADGAAALARTRSEKSADTLDLIGDSGREALAELRRLLAVIDIPATRRDTTPLAPQPTLQDLPALLHRVRAAGPAADLRTDGDLAPLSPGLQLTAYRIVQEALTNTLKHAAADTTVSVDLHRNGESVHLTVEDTGPPRAADSERHGRRSGQGLVGMHHRAALYQGRISAGPTPAGGWRVHTVLSTSRPLSSAVTEKHPL
ncbi:signal transduction histidine kinase [Streptomyces sp. V3I8]|uniref:sensor histidine kinase n=1 Tax=Streptomyces sp. V3I8 TaxID=3042279 RepID=UPI002787F4E6|nr:histidine kinase [Streptomyces sp. V3I8]MDQ1041210.1 signal transduction histidine kinase [Streptomyces sp. V3I8]